MTGGIKRSPTVFEALEERASRWREDFKGFCQAGHEDGEESGWKEKVKSGAPLLNLPREEVNIQRKQ